MEREMDMREIDEYKETQRLLDEGVVGYLPERISNRMLKRLLPFILFPVLGGIGLFGFYLYLAKNTEIDVPPAFVAFSTQVPFLAALLGITYSIMSTSWEPEVGRRRGGRGFRKQWSREGEKREVETQDLVSCPWLRLVPYSC
jgi:hypothetical protein